MPRDRLSTFLELAGAGAVAAGATARFGAAVGAMVIGALSMVFGYGIGNE